jgi:hypothetical protein
MLIVKVTLLIVLRDIYLIYSLEKDSIESLIILELIYL